MNRICSLALMLIVSTLTMAIPLTQQQALRKAQDFAGKHMHASSSQMTLAHVGRNAEVVGWYAFNIKGKKGFVIVSGSDQTDDILGYSDQGEFDYDQMPDNMKIWLEQYNECIQAISEGVMRPAKVFNHPSEVVEPMITSLWGQKEPFNSQCPMVNATHCPAGCTAVAMAQVMRYHRYPSASIDAIPSYTTSSLGITMPELPATAFDWDKMPDELTSESPQECIDEVSKFLLYCGQATEMNYDASGSGAFTNILPQRLPEYFNYPKTIHYVYRRAYNEEEWDSLLVRELVNGRPVIYTATTNLSQAHAFICDGYDGQGLYHINWGWVGVGNGYYRISVAHAEGEGLNENIKNYQLSLNQTALIGVKPAGKDDYVAPSEIYRVYTRPSLKGGSTYSRTSKKNNFEGITIKQMFTNTASVSKKLTYGIALCDENDNIISVSQATISTLTAGGSRTFETADLALGAGQVGHFTIKAVYKRSSSGEWRPMGGTEQNYIDAVLTSREMTLTSVPKANFVVKGLSMEDDNLNILFENNDEDFYGPIYIRRLVPTLDKIMDVSYDMISFESGTSREFSIYIDPSKKFDLYSDEFYLSVDEYDTHYFYTNLWEEDNILEKSIEVLNMSDDNTTIVGDRIMCRVIVSNTSEKPFKNYITVSTLDSNEQMNEAVRELIELQPGETFVKEYDVPIPDFSVDYSLVVAHKRNLYAWDSDSTAMMPVAEGAIYWTKDGKLKTQLAAGVFEVPEEALAINLRNAYTSNVTPNSNPNTIYMLDKTAPKGLSNSNYVNASNKGNRLVLVDGYDYYIPIKMTFSNGISYEREVADTVTFEWSTLTLPFTPTQVSVADSLIHWYADAEEGDFWLFDFEGVENDTVRTTYSSGPQANVPCLMACDERLAGKTIAFQTGKYTIMPTVIHPEVVKDDAKLVGTNALEAPRDCYLLKGYKWEYVTASSNGTGDSEDTSDPENPDDETDNGVDSHYFTETVEPSDTYEVPAFKAFLSTLAETPVKTLAIDADKIIREKPVPPPPVLIGDVNNDGKINMMDVTIIINYVLGMNPEGFIFERADVHKDELINMSDVSSVINIILGR